MLRLNPRNLFKPATPREDAAKKVSAEAEELLRTVRRWSAAATET